MRIGVPKEIKTLEHRVGLVPSSVKELTSRGHDVIVESGAGDGINFSDSAYESVGATIAPSAKDVFDQSDIIVKVKEPQEAEWKMLRSDHVLFTYLHLAADSKQAKGLIDSGCAAIAYETVTDKHGRGLPLLEPMSEIAGRLSVQVGAYYLQKHMGGLGRLIGGVPGVKPADALILGGGVSGFHAAQMATGLGANVTILEKSNARMRYLDDYFHGRANIVYSNVDTLEKALVSADLVIGAVLIPGGSAPKLVRCEHLKTMKKGAVMVDIAIDQGGCFETSRATTHNDPVYTEEGIVHYCVANMPGAVPLTSALALNHSVLPYLLDLVDNGWKNALKANPDFMNGLNIYDGKCTNEAVAGALDFAYTPPESLL